MAHRPGHRPGGGSRRGQFGRSQGGASDPWRNIYTSDLHLTNERGSWTVIEEEDYLTLRNNKNDKVYKLVMEEIE